MPTDLFSFTATDSVAAWAPVDDRVMGGCSNSRLRFDPLGHAVFEGTVKPDNNGGFASVRTRAMDGGAQGASVYVLKVCSDGKRYKFNLRTDDRLDGVTYQAAFAPPAGLWTAVRLPVSAFSATFRGRDVPGAPGLDPARVRQVGLMVADKQFGDFCLQVRAIATE